MAYYEQPPVPHQAGAYYGVPGQTAAPVKDLTLFGVLAFVTAAASTLFTVVDATVVGRAIRHADTVDDLDTLDWGVAVYAIGSVLAGVALVAGFVTGSMWLYRARTNAELLEPGRQYARSAGWAWGGWICPIVAFWFPYQVVRDTRKAVTPLSPEGLVGWWWAFYLFMTIGDRVMSRVESGIGVDDASGYQGASIFFALVTVVALVLWGMVLRAVTREQHDRIYGRVPAA